MAELEVKPQSPRKGCGWTALGLLLVLIASQYWRMSYITPHGGERLRTAVSAAGQSKTPLTFDGCVDVEWDEICFLSSFLTSVQEQLRRMGVENWIVAPCSSNQREGMSFIVFLSHNRFATCIEVSNYIGNGAELQLSTRYRRDAPFRVKLHALGNSTYAVLDPW